MVFPVCSIEATVGYSSKLLENISRSFFRQGALTTKAELKRPDYFFGKTSQPKNDCRKFISSLSNTNPGCVFKKLLKNISCSFFRQGALTTKAELKRPDYFFGKTSQPKNGHRKFISSLSNTNPGYVFKKLLENILRSFSR